MYFLGVLIETLPFWRQKVNRSGAHSVAQASSLPLDKNGRLEACPTSRRGADFLDQGAYQRDRLLRFGRRLLAQGREIAFGAAQGSHALSGRKVRGVHQVVEHVGELADLHLPGGLLEAVDIRLFAPVVFQALVLREERDPARDLGPI